MPHESGPSQNEAIDNLLELLPKFEAPRFIPATWPERFHNDENGARHQHVPYPDYSPEVEEFLKRLPAFTAGIHPYSPLPEDESQEGIVFSVLGTSFPMEYFQTASIDQVRRYFILLFRGERFCDGHIDGEFLSGKITAALRRLQVLRQQPPS